MSQPAGAQHVSLARQALPCIEVDIDHCLGEYREATAAAIAAALPIDGLAARAIIQDIDTPRTLIFVREDRDRPWAILIPRVDRNSFNAVFLAILSQAVRQKPSTPKGLGDDQGWP